MNIAVVDDNLDHANNLKEYLYKYSLEKKVDFSIEYFKDAEHLLKKPASTGPEIIFLDIYLNGITGLEAAQQLTAGNKETLIVFLAKNKEHILEAFHLHAYDYLLKPVEMRTIHKLMDDIMANFSDKNENLHELVFFSEKTEYHLSFDKIMAIKSEGHYLDIIVFSGLSYRTRMTFSEVLEKLQKDKRFLQVLRGIVVNMDYIKNIKKGICEMEKGVTIPVNIKNCKKLEQIWHNYMFKKNNE